MTKGMTALALMAALAGCPSMSTHKMAEPLPPGRWRVSAALDAVGFRDVAQDTRIPGVQVELEARRGVVPGLDLGLKLYGAGLEAGARSRLHRSGPWTVGMAPALGFVRTRESGVTTEAVHLFAHVPLLASRRMSPRWTLGFGPKALYGLYWPEAGGVAHGLSLGGFVGVDIRVRERWHLLPEINVYRSVAGEVPVRGAALQGGIAVALDL